jgi:hypothetical protein
MISFEIENGQVTRHWDHFLEKKTWSFSKKILRWAGHPILRPFLRKAWSFLRILRWAGHPILRPFLRKAWSFLKNFKRGWSPDIETIH